MSESILTEFRHSPRRVAFLAVAIAGLVFVYLFQETLVFSRFFSYEAHPYVSFVFKKTLRVVLNDSFMLLFIYAWFNTRAVTRVALWLQAIDTFVLLPLYLLVKLTLEGDHEISSPLLSQLHRLIVNPTLMVLFIPAVYFQRWKSPS